MSETITGGCLCGAIRYEAASEPIYAGYCYCGDCRKASGSGFAPFMGFAASAVRFSGEPRVFTCKAANGGDSDRNFCTICGGLVFGGVIGQVEQHTIYAGTLDDPSRFHPTMAIFNRDRPDWVLLPPGLTVFETMPE
ncbi:MAG TPA: GFA family protein [Caulobacteraceae bacterium]